MSTTSISSSFFPLANSGVFSPPDIALIFELYGVGTIVWFEEIDRNCIHPTTLSNEWIDSFLALHKLLDRLKEAILDHLVGSPRNGA